MLRALWLKVSYEPAITLELFKQIINLLLLFNLFQWDQRQVAGINIVIGLVLQVVTRQVVMPMAKLNDVVGEAKAKDIAASSGKNGK